MYQPTSTPSRACDEDLPLRLSKGDIRSSEDVKNSKYDLHMLAENCYLIWTPEGNNRHHKQMLAAIRIRVAVQSYGNYHGRRFSVKILRDGTFGIKVKRLS